MSTEKIIATVALTAASIVAQAGIIFDRSPDAIASPIQVENFLNVANDPNFPQWFSERFQVSAAATITGMDIYGNSYTTNPVGRKVLIRIWAGTEDEPMDLLFKELSVISEFDTEGTASEANLTRRFAALASPFQLSASRTYWVSMAGLTSVDNVGLASYVMADDGGMWVGRSGDKASGFSLFVGDMAFRLHGNTVPAPPTIWLVGCGLLLTALMQSRRGRGELAAKRAKTA